MTVEVDTARVSYTGAGTTGPFSIPFYFLANADIRAIKVTIADGTEDELALTTDFTLTGAGDEEGGTLTLVSSLSSSFKLVIFRDPEVLQESAYPRNDPFPSATHEQVADRLTMIAIRSRDLLERSVRLPDGDSSGASMVLPSSVSRQSKFLAFDANGAITVVDGSDGTTGSLAVALAASGGSALLGFLQSGSGAVARTTEAKLREIEISITDYGAADSADISTAFNRIKTAYPNGCTISIPETENHWLLSSKITTPDATPYVIKGRGVKSLIKKGFSGDMISLGKRSQMWDVFLDGDGGTYTGRGVIIESGANDATSWRRIINCDIEDMESYCVEFTQDTAGYLSEVRGGLYRTTGDSAAAFKFPDTDTNGNRELIGVLTGSTPLADLGSSQNTLLLGCNGGVPDFTDAPAKTRMHACRITGAAVSFDGTELNISGNVFAATGVTFAATLSNSKIRGNNYGSGATFTDNAGGQTSGNDIDYGQVVTYTPAWTSSGTQPALENGTLSGAAWREGQFMRVNMTFVAGSSTTFGTGTYSFSVPKAAARLTTGSAKFTDTTTAFFAGICEIAASATVVQLYGYNVGAQAGATNPFTWVSGDRFTLDICYPISG